MEKKTDGACRSSAAAMAVSGENGCPRCKNEGAPAGREAVEHLVAESCRKAITGEQYRICMDRDCPVVYYSPDNGTVFLQEQLTVPIWFKKGAEPKYACYCSKVTEEQVMEAVVSKGAKTVREVCVLTGAMRNSNCRENNPLGRCCREIIQAAIDKALAGQI